MKTVIVTPGALGLAVAFDNIRVAVIKAIKPSCNHKDDFRVGDHILTIDGKKVTELEDLRVGSDGERRMGIVSMSNEGAAGNKRKRGNNNNASSSSFDIEQCSSMQRLEQRVTHLQKMIRRNNIELRMARERIEQLNAGNSNNNSALATVAERNSLPPGKNCAEKVIMVPMVATEADGQEFFDEFQSGDIVGGTGGAGGLAAGSTNGGWQNAMFANVSSMQRTMVDIQNSVASHYAEYNKRLDRVGENVRRIAVVPGARIRSTIGGASEMYARASANLMKCPKDLYILWAEYEAGIGDNKPARQFTTSERGKVKFKYSRRKIAWDLIDKMVSAGSTSDEAIERIYSVYGQQPVNKIIEELRQARKTGGHPMLR